MVVGRVFKPSNEQCAGQLLTYFYISVPDTNKGLHQGLTTLKKIEDIYKENIALANKILE